MSLGIYYGITVTPKNEDDLQEQLRRVRADRYAFQSVAKSFLPKERVSTCLRNSLNGSNVQVWKHKKTQKAFYNGLMVCGSVWNCPVCAAKISEKRRQELKQAYDMHLSQGGHIAMLTLTFSHQKKDKLKDTLSKFNKATGRFRSGKRYQKIKDKIGLIGSIRAFEITYGKNGFHPHTHILLFYKNKVDLESLRVELYELWQIATKANDLSTSFHYGLTLQSAEKAQEYMSKHGTWGIDREMTKSHIKKGKEDSLTPFDFLRNHFEEVEGEDWKQLFKEYAEALKRKTQLYWSRGLKQMFTIEDKSDEDLAKEKTEEADLLALLEIQDWKQILKFNYRTQFLDDIEKHGYEKAYDFLQNRLKFYTKKADIKNADID